VLREFAGESLAWHLAPEKGNLWLARGELRGAEEAEASPYVGFATTRHPLPFRGEPSSGHDWVRASTPSAIKFYRRLRLGEKGFETLGVDIFLPQRAEVTVAPLPDRGGRVEWKLVSDSLELSLRPRTGKGEKAVWEPGHISAAGSVSFFNYGSGSRKEAWGFGRSLVCRRQSEVTSPLPDVWTLVLEGNPAVRFDAAGEYIVDGRVYTGSEDSRAPGDAEAALDAARKITVTVSAAGTPSEMITVKAHTRAKLAVKSTEEEGEKTFFTMKADVLRADIAKEGKKAGIEGTPRRILREVEGRGETEITQIRSGLTGVYRGRDLRFNPFAGEGEDRITAPGKWTFEKR
jgi:hypothetical protein